MLDLKAGRTACSVSERARARWFPAPFPTMEPLIFSALGNDSMLAIGTCRIAPMELGRMNSAEPA